MQIQLKFSVVFVFFEFISVTESLRGFGPYGKNVQDSGVEDDAVTVDFNGTDDPTMVIDDFKKVFPKLYEEYMNEKLFPDVQESYDRNELAELLTAQEPIINKILQSRYHPNANHVINHNENSNTIYVGPKEVQRNDIFHKQQLRAKPQQYRPSFSSSLQNTSFISELLTNVDIFSVLSIGIFTLFLAYVVYTLFENDQTINRSWKPQFQNSAATLFADILKAIDKKPPY